MSAARAMQYARTLTPDELHAVHFAVDPAQAQKLQGEWERLGLARIDLELIDCPDRRLDRTALQMVAEILAAGDTEVSVLIPRVEYTRFWHRLLHDHSSERIAEAVGRLAHANVTFVPYHLGQGLGIDATATRPPRRRTVAPAAKLTAVDVEPAQPLADGLVPIAGLRHRQRARVGGRVHSVRVQAWGSTPSLEMTLRDDTGSITVVFLGRRHIAGVEPGVRMIVGGTVGEHSGRLAILNPRYDFIA